MMSVGSLADGVVNCKCQMRSAVASLMSLIFLLYNFPGSERTEAVQMLSYIYMSHSLMKNERGIGL
jgi:hypothetical protein